MARKKRQKLTEPERPSALKKWGLRLGAAAAIGAAGWLASHKKPASTPPPIVSASSKEAGRECPRDYFEHAKDLFRAVHWLENGGAVKIKHMTHREVEERTRGFSAFDHLNATCFLPPRESPFFGFASVHEYLHVLHWRSLSNDFRAFQQLMAPHQEPNPTNPDKTDTILSKALFEKFVETLPASEQKRFFRGKLLDYRLAEKAFRARFKQHADELAQMHVLQEIHAHLFTPEGSISDRHLYRDLTEKFRNNSFPSWEEFLKIKSAIIKLYCASGYSHVKVAEIVGANSHKSASDFIASLYQLPSVRQVTERQANEFDARRRQMIKAAADKVGLSVKPKY